MTRPARLPLHARARLSEDSPLGSAPPPAAPPAERAAAPGADSLTPRPDPRGQPAAHGAPLHLVPPSPTSRRFVAYPEVARRAVRGPTLAAALRDAPAQEGALVGAGLYALGRRLQQETPQRIARAVHLASQSTASERAPLVACIRALGALRGQLAVALQQNAAGELAAPPSPRATDHLRAAFAAATGALAALPPAQQVEVVGSSSLYPACPVAMPILTILARLWECSDSTEGELSRAYRIRHAEIGRETVAMQDRGLPASDVSERAWKALHAAGEQLRRAPAIAALEEQIVARQVDDVRLALRAGPGHDRRAWAATARATGRVIDSFAAAEDLGRTVSPDQLDPESATQIAWMRARALEIRQFGRGDAQVARLLTLNFMTRHLQADESRHSGYLARQPLLPQDVLVTTLQLHAAVGALRRAAARASATRRAQFDAIARDVDELRAEAAMVLVDGSADNTLLSFAQFTADRAAMFAQRLRTCARLRADLAALDGHLGAEAARRAAGAARPTAPVPSTAASGGGAANPDDAAGEDLACGGAPDVDLDDVPSRWRADDDQGGWLVAALRGRSAAELVTASAAGTGWLTTLRRFTAAERQLATECFDPGTFATSVESAAYHFCKHREPRQSLRQYVDGARAAMAAAAGTAVPSLRDPAVMLRRISNEATLCVFTAVGKVVTFRNRRALDGG